MLRNVVERDRVGTSGERRERGMINSEYDTLDKDCPTSSEHMMAVMFPWRKLYMDKVKRKAK